VTLTSHSFTSSVPEATSFLPKIAAAKYFWSAKEELLLIALRKSKMTVAKMVSQFQTPPRTENSLTKHVQKIKLRLKNDGELTAEWTEKYAIASSWELREGCRFEQLQQWISRQPVAQSLTSRSRQLLKSLLNVYKHPSFKRLVDCLDGGEQPLDAVIACNRQELLAGRSGICATDIWGFYTLHGFCPVLVSTALHRQFESGKFHMRQLASLLSQEMRSFLDDNKRAVPLDNLLVILDGFKAHPWFTECIDLLKLGFVPMRIACKLGEQERAGACMHKYVAFKVKGPALQRREEVRSAEHYADILGMPCYLGNSHVSEVVYRGNDFTAAAEATESRQHRVVDGLMLLMLKCFPDKLKGMPVGAHLLHNSTCALRTSLKTIGGAYPIMIIDDTDICLFLISPLVSPDHPIMYLHTRHRTSTGAGSVGKMVDCPISIGGDGSPETPWGTVTLNRNHTAVE
jgi:hypothetical protein